MKRIQALGAILAASLVFSGTAITGAMLHTPQDSRAAGETGTETGGTGTTGGSETNGATGGEAETLTVSKVEAKYNGGAIEKGTLPAKTDITVTVTYSNNSTKVLTPAQFDVAKKDGTDDTFAVAYQYNGKTTASNDFKVTLKDPATVTSTKVSDVKAVYNGSAIEKGRLPEKADVAVTVTYLDTYSDNTSRTRTEKAAADTYEIVKKDGTDNTFYVSYKYNNVTYKSDEFTVTLKDAATVKTSILKSLKAVYNGKTLNAGTQPNKDDVTLTATYADTYTDGTTKDRNERVASKDFTATGSTAKGANTWIFAYKDMTAAAVINFTEKTVKTTKVNTLTAAYKGKKLKVGTEPSKTDFEVKANVTYTYDDNTTETKDITVDPTLYTLSGATTEGVQEWTVKYLDGTAKVNITYEKADSATVTSTKLLSIEAIYTGTELKPGTTPEKSAFSVTGTYQDTYADGSQKTRTALIPESDFTITGSTEAGSNLWTITVNDAVNATSQTTGVTVPFTASGSDLSELVDGDSDSDSDSLDTDDSSTDVENTDITSDTSDNSSDSDASGASGGSYDGNYGSPQTDDKTPVFPTAAGISLIGAGAGMILFKKKRDSILAAAADDDDSDFDDLM